MKDPNRKPPRWKVVHVSPEVHRKVRQYADAGGLRVGRLVDRLLLEGLKRAASQQAIRGDARF